MTTQTHTINLGQTCATCADRITNHDLPRASTESLSDLNEETGANLTTDEWANTLHVAPTNWTSGKMYGCAICHRRVPATATGVNTWATYPVQRRNEYAVTIHEDGKLLGHLTFTGGVSSLTIKTAVFTQDRANEVAADITDADPRFVATVAPF